MKFERLFIEKQLKDREKRENLLYSEVKNLEDEIEEL
jgi:hypothetical protein